jgi:Domain of unknown function (DUF4249)
MKKITYILLITISFFGCETSITPELDTAEKILVVDAWINQKMERQEIRITQSQSYFDNSIPTKISNATVTVEDLTNGTIYNFQEGTSAYFWDPTGAPFGEVGHQYKLTVIAKGETFQAFSNLGRVPSVDSILFKYKPAETIIKEEYYLGEFMAKDPVGVGDAYWIKAWKNGVFLGKPTELNMAFDAGFSPGQPVDGQEFLIPIRSGFTNPFDKVSGKQNEFLPPYKVGDSLYVEVHSINPLAFDFLYGVYFQIARSGGFAELFALPLTNSSTNLKSTDKNSITNVAGFFNVAAVSSSGRKLTQELADEAKRIAE